MGWGWEEMGKDNQAEAEREAMTMVHVGNCENLA